MTSSLPRPRKYFPAGFVPRTQEMNDSFSARENTIAASAAWRWTLVRLSPVPPGGGRGGFGYTASFSSFALGGGGEGDHTSCKFVRT